MALIAACARVLEPGGRLLIATPNACNLIVLEETFWLDPTHVRPYPRALLERMGSAEGLHVVASYDDPTTSPRRPFLRRAIAQLRSWLSGADRSGPMDSVVVFEKPRA
jgi:SAM-dependent methyltransferase